MTKNINLERKKNIYLEMYKLYEDSKKIIENLIAEKDTKLKDIICDNFYKKIKQITEPLEKKYNIKNGRTYSDEENLFNLLEKICYLIKKYHCCDNILYKIHDFEVSICYNCKQFL